jgi:hypothetical protein
MTKKDIYERMARFGYPLHQPSPAEDFVSLLKDMLSSTDYRILEGVPVVMANFLRTEGEQESIQAISKSLDALKHEAPSKHMRAHIILLVSIALMEGFGNYFQSAKRLRNAFVLSPDSSNIYNSFLNSLQSDKPIEKADVSIDPSRWKRRFRQYNEPPSKPTVSGHPPSARRLIALEYALSQLFSSKQKELIWKKISGEALTKTENEYFSRVVKKKLTALADPDLRDLAIRALQ